MFLKRKDNIFMLTRVISAVVMFAILGVCVFLSPISRVLLLCICALCALLEMGNAMRRLRFHIEQIPLTIYIVVHSVLCLFQTQFWTYVCAYGAVLLSILCICIVKNCAKDALGTLFVLNYPMLLFAFVIWVLMQDNWKITSATSCFATWLCDAFALFGGKLIGKHKLAPHVSPNKTIEGAICGAVFSLLGGLAAWYILKDTFELSVITALLTALIASTMGQFGDLAASLFKRAAGLKDYSKLIPGHGGMLDRADSLLFAIPTAWICFKVLGLLY